MISVASIQSTETKQSSSIPNYRKVVRQALPESFFKTDYTPLWWIPFHLAIIGLGIWLLKSHFHPLSALPIALVIGHSFGCLGFIAHDIAHGGTIKSIPLRDLLSGIAFSPFAIGPMLWRKWHNGEHHTHTQVQGVDPDHLFTMEHYERSPILQFLYRLHPVLRNLVIFGSFTYRMSQQMMRMFFAYMFARNITVAERLTIFFQLVLPVAFWAGGTLALGSQVFWWGYFFPLLVGNALVIAYIATNHFLNPLADERDVLATSLSVTLPKWLGWLDALHSHFGAHVAHHLFPQASPRFGRQIDEKIKELFPDRYHEMPLTLALKLLWDTPWVYEGKTVLKDPQSGKSSGTLGHGLEH